MTYIDCHRLTFFSLLDFVDQTQGFQEIRSHGSKGYPRAPTMSDMKVVGALGLGVDLL